MTMNGLQAVGWSMVVLGAVIAVIGLFLVLGPRIPFLGHLPGDIVIQRENVTIYLPLGTMVVVSIVVSVVLAILRR